MKNIELLIKPVSYDCNLKCEYCFYKSTESIYPNQRHLMSDDILKTLIKKSLSFSDGGLAVFSWQGGEPLLAGIDFFKKVINFQSNLGKSGQRIGNSIQTNGLLLNKEWIRLLKEFNTFVGISLDGNEEMHNYYRNNSFKKVMDAISLLNSEKVEFNILTVINNLSVKKPKEIYEFYLSNNLIYVQLIPCAEKDNNKITNASVNPEYYGKFLCDFFDLWYNDGNPKISVRFFDNIMEVLSGTSPGCCGFKDECGDYLVIEANGDIYPCDFFVKTNWRLGNIISDSFEGLFKLVKENFGKLKSKTAEKCKICKWFFLCKGGCLKYRAMGETKYNLPDYFCVSYKKFFDYCIERLKKFISKDVRPLNLNAGRG